MSDVPSDLHYVRSHEWVKIDDDGSAVIGLTDHAQETLGDVVFVELPEKGTTLASGDEAGVVESVKAASDIYAPVSGEVIAVNALLGDTPETINSDPYGHGWIFKVKLTDDRELSELMDADAYNDFVEAEE
ncbi:Glycine cleavage system H protein [invertebrate metagenome]|uniref:Glycine cleavage system H protein n=1 Tax=invertebrate metagenome TaxID=1711999 RepID=A0A2H9T9I2_9ZZZZ